MLRQKLSLFAYCNSTKLMLTFVFATTSSEQASLGRSPVRVFPEPICNSPRKILSGFATLYNHPTHLRITAGRLPIDMFLPPLPLTLHKKLPSLTVPNVSLLQFSPTNSRHPLRLPHHLFATPHLKSRLLLQALPQPEMDSASRIRALRISRLLKINSSSRA